MVTLHKIFTLSECVQEIQNVCYKPEISFSLSRYHLWGEGREGRGTEGEEGGNEGGERAEEITLPSICGK